MPLLDVLLRVQENGPMNKWTLISCYVRFCMAFRVCSEHQRAVFVESCCHVWLTRGRHSRELVT